MNIDEKISTIIATPFLNPPLDHIRGDELKEVWDWQKKQIQSIAQEAIQAERQRILSELENHPFSIPIGDGTFKGLVCRDCKEERFWCAKCVKQIISKP